MQADYQRLVRFPLRIALGVGRGWRIVGDARVRMPDSRQSVGAQVSPTRCRLHSVHSTHYRASVMRRTDSSETRRVWAERNVGCSLSQLDEAMAAEPNVHFNGVTSCSGPPTGARIFLSCAPTASGE